MKTKRLIFFSLLIITIAFGIYIAIVIMDRYELVVRGTLGFTTLYLLHQHYLSPQKNRDESVGILIEFPRDIKHLISGFFLSIVMFWAFQQVLEIVRYLFKLLKVY